MEGMVHKASKILYHLSDDTLPENAKEKGSSGISKYNDKLSNALGDRKIPLFLIKNARAIAFITEVKTGFILAPRGGTGIIIARLPNGKWSGPSAIGTGGIGFGITFGASITDTILILNTDYAVKAFSKNSCKLGGDLQVAAGPWGRDMEAGVAFNKHGIAPAYSYSYAKGLFFGATIDGAIVMKRSDCNKKFYGAKASTIDILTGVVKPPNSPALSRLFLYLDTLGNDSKGGYNAPDPNKLASIPNKGSAVPPAAVAALQKDHWEEVVDESSGKSYWWNKETQETTGVGAARPTGRSAMLPPPVPAPGTVAGGATLPPARDW